MDDRYRGVYGERRVVFINPEDLAELGCEAGDTVDVVGEHDDGVSRVAEGLPLRALRYSARLHRRATTRS